MPQLIRAPEVQPARIPQIPNPRQPLLPAIPHFPPANNFEIFNLRNGLPANPRDNNHRIAQIMGEIGVDADEAVRILRDNPQVPLLQGPQLQGAQVARPRVREFMNMQSLLQNRPGQFIPPDQDQPIPGYRYGMCPVCLLVGEEIGDAGNCLYHVHRCPVGRRNERLWRKYSNNRDCEHCFTCGRACRGHGHYRLTDTDNTPDILPALPINNGDGFVRGAYWQCSASGGGDRIELIARLLGIIDYINTLREGEIEDNQDFITRCSDAAEIAALDRNILRDAQISLDNNQFIRNIRDNLRFGRNQANPNAVLPHGVLVPVLGILAPRMAWRPVVEEAGAVFLRGLGIVNGLVRAGVGFLCAARGRQPPRNINPCPVGHQIPEVLTIQNRGEKKCYLCELVGGEESPRDIYRFRHNNRGNIAFIHPDDKLICLEHITQHIASHTNDPADAEYYNSDCFCTQREGCGGSIHPCELDILRIQNNILYNTYVNSHFPNAGGKRRNRTRHKKNIKRKFTRSKKFLTV